MMRVCSASTGEGTLWPVDAALRPEGKAGPLVRTLASHVAYYERWAKTWEFQALLKARPVAGDLALGAGVRRRRSRRWCGRPPTGPTSSPTCRRCAAGSRSTSRRPRPTASSSSGRGGLRDVEFAVQLLQLVHGRADESLRSGEHAGGAEALSTGGYVGRDDAADAGPRPTGSCARSSTGCSCTGCAAPTCCPTDDGELRRLGRSLGLRADAGRRELRRASGGGTPARSAGCTRSCSTGRCCRRSPGCRGRGAADARRRRGRGCEALGFADPAGALRHLEALTAGVSAGARRSSGRCCRCCSAGSPTRPTRTPGCSPSARSATRSARRTWYLRLLRDEGAVAERLARAARLQPVRRRTCSRRAPEARAAPRPTTPSWRRARRARRWPPRSSAAVGRHDDPAQPRSRSPGRCAAASCSGSPPPTCSAVSTSSRSEAALTDVAAATVQAALDAAVARSVGRARGGPLPTRLAVDRDGPARRRARWATAPTPTCCSCTTRCAAPTSATAPRRRTRSPTSCAGCSPCRRPTRRCASTPTCGRRAGRARWSARLASYAAYYERWSLVWEAQALLRAEPVAGDAELGARFVALVDPLRYPAAA